MQTNSGHKYEVERAMRILQELGYDLQSTKSVHEQFLERYKDGLSKPSKPKKLRKIKK